MRRRTFLWVALLTLTLTAWGGKGNGKGKGNGGGGGGGGGAADANSTIHYYDPATGQRSVHADGSGDVPVTTHGRPTYDAHNAKVWFTTDGVNSTTNPDGAKSTRIVVWTGTGIDDDRIVVVNGTVDERYRLPRWAKDDSFLSYVKVEWTGTGATDADATLVRVDVTWDANGDPSFGALEEFVFDVGLDPSREDAGFAEPNMNSMDWAPAGEGDKFVFDDRPNTNLSTLRVRDVAATSTSSLGGGYHPQWSPDGARIAYDRDFRIRAVNPDGTDDTLISGKKPKDRGFWFPQWSPDSAFLASARSSGGVYYFSSGGGGKTQVTSNGTVTVAWR